MAPSPRRWATADSFLNLPVGVISFSVIVTLLSHRRRPAHHLLPRPAVRVAAVRVRQGLRHARAVTAARPPRRRTRQPPRAAPPRLVVGPPQGAGHDAEPVEGDRLLPRHAAVRDLHLRPRRGGVVRLAGHDRPPVLRQPPAGRDGQVLAVRARGSGPAPGWRWPPASWALGLVGALARRRPGRRPRRAGPRPPRPQRGAPASRPR